MAAFHFDPSLNLVLVNEPVHVLNRIAEKSCCFGYAPGTVSVIEFVVWVHFLSVSFLKSTHSSFGSETSSYLSRQMQ